MPEWAPLARNYENDELQHALDRTQASTSHPLLPRPRQSLARPVIVKRGSATATTIVDPLGAMDPLGAAGDEGALLDPLSAMALGTSGGVELDPLSALSSAGSSGSGSGATLESRRASEVAEQRRQNLESARQTALENHEKNLRTPWQIKKAQIFKEYSIMGSVTLSSEAMSEVAGSGVEDGSATRHLDRYAQRLANLEKRHLNKMTVELTQQQYEEHVMRLSMDLNRAWGNDERVGSLKIAIQLAKLLADTNMPQFYPCMFVLVTDVLERFGEMVFTRLKAKAEEALNDGLPGSKKKVCMGPLHIIRLLPDCCPSKS